MASSILLRSARSGRKHIDLASRFLPAKTWPARIGSFPRFFSYKDPDVDVIGIDFGTTNSCVSVFEGNGAKVIKNSEGCSSIPSVVAYGSGGECLVGVPAKLQALTNPDGTVYDLKRIIGRRFDDLAPRKVPYQIISASNGDALVKVNGKSYSPSEIFSELLKKLKETGKNYFGKDVINAVITVPACFDDAQRRGMVKAGSLAGFKIIKIISEPYAAALAYGTRKKEDGHVAVVHFGGATLVVTILEMSHGMIEIKATTVATFGGKMFDSILLHYLGREFNEAESIDLSKDKLALERLWEAAEKAKVELSAATETKIHLPCISGDKHLNITLSRSEFESLVSSYIEEIKRICQDCLKQAGVTPKDIVEVLLTGSSTRVVKVREVVTEIFRKSPSEGVNPDEAIALGAAIEAGILSKELEVTVDWYMREAVTSVMTQGSENSCWVIGVLAASEGIFSIKNKDLRKFSVQQVLDCAGPGGCKGSSQERAFLYLMTDGVCLEEEYPYTGTHQQCVSTKAARIFIDGFGRVPAGNKNLIDALKRQPLTAGLSGSFIKSPLYLSYKGGPFFGDDYDFSLSGALPHLVCIFGCEVIEGQKFLKIKESKGKEWGDGGTLLLAMNREYLFGLGDVNMDVCYPIVDGDKAVHLSDRQICKLKEAFNRFDEDGDKRIETKLLGKVATYLGKTLTEAELRDLLTEVGSGQNGTIAFPHFRNLMARKLNYIESVEFEEIFRKADQDQDGLISASDFLMEMNGDINEASIRGLFEIADTDGDGQLNCDEFVKLFL